jgi:hypothetical protein
VAGGAVVLLTLLSSFANRFEAKLDIVSSEGGFVLMALTLLFEGCFGRFCDEAAVCH